MSELFGTTTSTFSVNENSSLIFLVLLITHKILDKREYHIIDFLEILSSIKKYQTFGS